MEEAITYGLTLIGAPYHWWTSRDQYLGEGAPAWASDNLPPESNKVITDGLFCAGLINLMRRRIGLCIPQNPPFNGGICAYSYYFDKVIIPFSLEEIERGDILFRKYTDVADQGHIAVALGGQHDPVLQCFSNGIFDTKPGVNIMYSAIESHAGYYYQYIIKHDVFWKM